MRESKERGRKEGRERREKRREEGRRERELKMQYQVSGGGWIEDSSITHHYDTNS